jgi:hypothetical protein
MPMMPLLSPIQSKQMDILLDLTEQQAENCCGGRKSMNTIGVGQESSALNLALGFGFLPNLISSTQLNYATVDASNWF